MGAPAKEFSDYELDYLDKYIFKKSLREMAEHLGCSYSTIARKRKECEEDAGISKKKMPMVKYVSGYKMVFDGVNWKQCGTI